MNQARWRIGQNQFTAAEVFACRWHRHVNRILLIVAMLTTVGCQSPGWWRTALTAATVPDVDPQATETTPRQPPREIVDETDLAEAATSAAAKPASAPLPESLADDRWVMTVRPMVPGVNEPATRWRHPALDALLAAPLARRPVILAGLTSDKPAVVANTAIVLGRWHQRDTSAELAGVIRDESARLPLRQAAIETLGLLNTPAASKTLIELMADNSDAADAPLTPLSQIPELYSELLCARSQYVHPNEDPRFLAALSSRSSLVRAEAAAAWARNTSPAKQQTPDRLVELCTDSDTRVRMAALRAILVQQHPRAGEVLNRATRDFDLSVRMMAIAALGEMGTHDAKQVLDKLRRNPSEVARAAAVAALATAGANDVVLAAAADESFRVRKAVAESLDDLKADAQQLGQDYQSLAKKLVRDASVEVQRSTVQSLQSWPLEQAGPALLLAMVEGGYTTRKMAAEQLAERWEPARKFYVDGTTDSRHKQIVQLRSLWEQEFGTLQEGAIRAAADQLAVAAGVSPEQLKQIESALTRLADPDLSRQLRAESVERLQQLGPELSATLESWTHDQLRQLPAEVYETVLPKIDPLFKPLGRLTDPSETVRRAALGELRQHLARQKLSNAALSRLAMLMESETDPLVWQAALGLVASDPRQIAVRLAYVAVANASSEVRRRACENMQLAPNAEHWAVLLPMLQDPNVTVAIAAARALGAVGIIDPAPLAALLSTPDLQLRHELAVALARSNVEHGIAALERLAREADADVRRAAATAMGELRNALFVPTLVKLLDDRHDVQTAALASLVEVTGHDVQQGDELNLIPDEKCRRWKEWHRAQTAGQE